MMDDWTAEVVGRMHALRITGQQLADESGYNATYLSTVLNGHKGNDQTKQRIFEALDRLEQRMSGTTGEEVPASDDDD